MRARFYAFMFALVRQLGAGPRGVAAARKSGPRGGAEPRRLVSRLLRRRVRERRRRRELHSGLLAAAADVSPVRGGRGAIAAPPSAAEMLRARHRDLRSDFLLVKSPETQALVPFRDVIQVDGITVRDREARLAKLFLNGIGRRDEPGGAHPRGRHALQPRQHAQHARQSGARPGRPAAVVSAAVSFLARRRKTGPSARA